MLKKLDERELKALHSLKASNDWQDVRKALENSLAGMKHQMIYVSNELQLRQLQGACQMIDELFKAEENASKSLSKY